MRVYFVSGIINYNFGLSAFILPKTGVKMVKSTLYNHYLIRICSLDVDMNNANEASLYCRRLESITFSPQKMLKM
jgi:hypothetical protein